MTTYNKKKLLANKEQIIHRLRYAQGHLKAVEAMVHASAYCMDIINQNHAVIEALKKVNKLILEGYLGECVLDAVQNKNLAKRMHAVTELVKLYSKK